jgi:hypothetical protein
MEFPVMSRASGQARPGVHRFRGTTTGGHGAHVPGLLPGAPLQALAAEARKVLPNRHLLKRPSPDGLPGGRDRAGPGQQRRAQRHERDVGPGLPR